MFDLCLRIWDCHHCHRKMSVKAPCAMLHIPHGPPCAGSGVNVVHIKLNAA